MPRDVCAQAVLHDRRERPRQMVWSGVIQSAHGPVNCLVTELDDAGARLTFGNAALAPGLEVTLVVTGIGLFRGAIVAAERGGAGIRFYDA